MKTTIDVSAPLFKKVKKYAAEHHTSFKTLVELGLQYVLLRNGRFATDKFKLKKRSVPGKGLQADLDWGCWERIRKMAYEGRGDVIE